MRGSLTDSGAEDKRAPCQSPVWRRDGSRPYCVKAGAGLTCLAERKDFGKPNDLKNLTLNLALCPHRAAEQ
jgi:hypothetical protein